MSDFLIANYCLSKSSVITSLNFILNVVSILLFSIPIWSRHHPQIPQRYVPPWTQDMKNRSLILEVI